MATSEEAIIASLERVAEAAREEAASAHVATERALQSAQAYKARVAELEAEMDSKVL